MERTFHDLHLESSQGIVGQILQKLWWKEGIFHINSYLPLMVIARCGKFLLSIITFKVFDPQFSTTTLNEDHEKFFLERTYFLYFRTQIKEKWCFFRDLCGFIGVGGTSIPYYFCLFYSPLHSRFSSLLRTLSKINLLAKIARFCILKADFSKNRGRKSLLNTKITELDRPSKMLWKTSALWTK